MCYIEFDNECSVYRNEQRTARKEHRCSTCGATIAKGDRYLNLFAKSDGQVYSERQCTACMEIAERFSKAHHNQTPFPSGLWDFIDQCVDEGDADSERWRIDLDAIAARRDAAKEAARAASV